MRKTTKKTLKSMMPKDTYIKEYTFRGFTLNRDKRFGWRIVNVALPNPPQDMDTLIRRQSMTDSCFPNLELALKAIDRELDCNSVQFIKGCP